MNTRNLCLRIIFLVTESSRQSSTSGGPRGLWAATSLSGGPSGPGGGGGHNSSSQHLPDFNGRHNSKGEVFEATMTANHGKQPLTPVSRRDCLKFLARLSITSCFLIWIAFQLFFISRIFFYIHWLAKTWIYLTPCVFKYWTNFW